MLAGEALPLLDSSLVDPDRWRTRKKPAMKASTDTCSNLVWLDRSRLGCQVHLTKDMEGMVATLPSATRNM